MSLALAHKRSTLALGSAAVAAAAGALVAYSPADALSSPANARKNLLLQEAGYRVESLVRIASLEDGRVTFVEDEEEHLV